MIIPESGESGQNDKRKFEFVNLRTEEPQPPSDEETRFFRQKYQPPFVTFVGSGRRVASPLTPLQAVATGYAFPAFLGKATVNREGAAEPEWAQDLRSSPAYDKIAERQLKMRGSLRRRYSGDTHEPLPRDRYFALYGESATERSYTLLGELNGYALPMKCGYCTAVPSAEPDAFGVQGQRAL